MTCKKCNGKKTMVIPANKSGIGMAITVDCPVCNGMGKVNEPGVCCKCHGRKIIATDWHKMGVQVPCPDCSEPKQ